MGRIGDLFKAIMYGPDTQSDEDLLAKATNNNKPTTIMVDLIITKVFRNLDFIAFEDTPSNVRFTWKRDEVVVSMQAEYNVTNNEYTAHKDVRRGFKRFGNTPSIKIDGVNHPLTPKEQQQLFNACIKAGKLKQKQDKEKEEFQRQQKALEAINFLAENESDDLKEIKNIAAQAMKALPAPAENKYDAVKKRITTA